MPLDEVIDEPQTTGNQSSQEAAVIAQIDALEAADAAESSKAGQGDNGAAPAPAQPKNVVQLGKETPATKTSDQNKAGASTPEADKAKADAEAKAKAEAAPKPNEPSKFAKDRERLGKTWKDANEQKERNKQEAEQNRLAREQLAREKAEWEAQQKTPTPEELDAAAQKFEDEGKFDFAEEARKQAKHLRENPPKPKAAVQAQAELKNQQTASWQQAAKEFPELGNKESPIHKAVLSVLQGYPDLMKLPGGPIAAAKYAAATLAAAEVPALKEQIAKQTAELEKLRKATSLTGPGAPPNGQGPKTWSEQSEAEQEAWFRGQVAQR